MQPAHFTDDETEVGKTAAVLSSLSIAAIVAQVMNDSGGSPPHSCVFCPLVCDEDKGSASI